MKVKSLFLSMCAIAALASCSQNEDEVAPPVSNATEATVTIKLAGNDLHSRVVGAPETDTDKKLADKNSKVNDITVFILNKDKVVIAKKWLQPNGQGAFEPISTTTDAHQVIVITNTGKAMSDKIFASIGNETALRGVITDLLDNNNVTQTVENLYMSGTGDVGAFADEGGVLKATAPVQLNYLPARVKLEKITFNGGTTQNNVYAPYTLFANNASANFTITRIYLINVQRQSRFLPLNPEHVNNYTEGVTKSYTGGVAMGIAPWADLSPNGYKQNAEYTIEGSATSLAVGTTPNTISNIGHWYTFMNTDVTALTAFPTALVVEVQWRETKAHTSTGPNDLTVAEKLTTLYFTVYFGGGDKGQGSAISELEAGKAYKVSLALNGNFLPALDGGSGGGGTTDPSKPTINSAVTVTITQAKWNLVPEINKEWKD